MTISPTKQASGFTLVELLIGMSLALMVMGGILSGYIFLGRSFTRSLGVSSAGQPTLETQGRRTLTYLAQDAHMASGVDLTGTAPSVLPSSSGVTLILPTSTGNKSITYSFNNSSAMVMLGTFQIPPGCLIRIDQSTGTAMTLHTNLLTLYFRYFDSSGRPYDNATEPYTTSTDYLSGIKQVSLSFTSQAGSAANGTQTQVYSSDSPLLLFRNKPLLR